MSGHVLADSRLPSSPLGLTHSKHAPIYAPDSITIWHSSPSKPKPAPHNGYDFDVEEVSENDTDYPDEAQILYPYELEEVDSPKPNGTPIGSQEEVEEAEDTQDSDSSAFAHRLRRMRWQPSSRPYAFARPSPMCSNPRKRLRSEVPDTDAESDGYDSPYTRSEPPKLRRRTQPPSNTSTVGTPSDMSDVSTAHALNPDDIMDLDEKQA